jgi:hypothetical protein
MKPCTGTVLCGDGTMTTDCSYRQGLRFHLSGTSNEAGKTAVPLPFQSRTSVALKAYFGEFYGW